MNSQKPRSKMGKIDHSLNSLSKFLFLFLTFLSLIMVVLHGIDFHTTAPLLLFFRYILLLSSIIPISMRVNLDVAKVVYSRNIAQDPYIKGTIARNRVIPEELGLIRYLLSDKTGTLTKNEMIFKKLSLETEVFTIEQTELIKKMIMKATRGPMETGSEHKDSLKCIKDSINPLDNIPEQHQDSILISVPLSVLSTSQGNNSVISKSGSKK